MKNIIAYDLGTGGVKSSLYSETGELLCSTFISYDTYYPGSGLHEQRPNDWWNSIVSSTKELVDKANIDVENVVSLAISGHSLGVVPIGKDGKLLDEFVPIWSDARAENQAIEFFKTIPEADWYNETGNGFPAPLYSIFKIMWYRDEKPDIYNNTAKFIGTKDYINYLLTNVLCTDRSYASGSGVYSLSKECYVDSFINASGIDADKLPRILQSVDVVGTILPEVAKKIGLSPKTLVCAGGVDNACMALGAACIEDGDAYTSLGSSSWIAVCDSKPVLNEKSRPYVFAHCLPGKYVSATCIFSAGNSLRWVRDTICAELKDREKQTGVDAYIAMTDEAVKSPVGANGLIFNPSLAGGTALDDSVNIRGCFAGLDLMHCRGDIIRSTLEGIALNLGLALEVLEEQVKISSDMLIVGGGGKSSFWRQIFADVYQKNIIETNVGQEAGSLGAAVVAAIGAGIFEDFSSIKALHTLQGTHSPNKCDCNKYNKIKPIFKEVAKHQAIIGNMIRNVEKG